MGILLGYTEVGYRVLVNNKIIVARHVDIVEDNIKCIGLEDIDSDCENVNDLKYKSDLDLMNSKIQNDFEKKMLNTQDKDQVKEIRRSERERKPPNRFVDNYAYNNAIYVNFCSANNEAIESKESNNWSKAMTKEIDFLEKNKTWQLVDKPKNKDVLDVK